MSDDDESSQDEACCAEDFEKEEHECFKCTTCDLDDICPTCAVECHKKAEHEVEFCGTSMFTCKCSDKAHPNCTVRPALSKFQEKLLGKAIDTGVPAVVEKLTSSPSPPPPPAPPVMTMTQFINGLVDIVVDKVNDNVTEKIKTLFDEELPKRIPGIIPKDTREVIRNEAWKKMLEMIAKTITGVVRRKVQETISGFISQTEFDKLPRSAISLLSESLGDKINRGMHSIVGGDDEPEEEKSFEDTFLEYIVRQMCNPILELVEMELEDKIQPIITSILEKFLCKILSPAIGEKLAEMLAEKALEVLNEKIQDKTQSIILDIINDAIEKNPSAKTAIILSTANFFYRFCFRCCVATQIEVNEEKRRRKEERKKKREEEKEEKEKEHEEAIDEIKEKTAKKEGAKDEDAKDAEDTKEPMVAIPPAPPRSGKGPMYHPLIPKANDNPSGSTEMM